MKKSRIAQAGTLDNGNPKVPTYENLLARRTKSKPPFEEQSEVNTSTDF